MGHANAASGLAGGSGDGVDAAMDCTQVLSGDLRDGQDYGGVQVANPFR
jgi:hypothetical protein